MNRTKEDLEVKRIIERNYKQIAEGKGGPDEDGIRMLREKGFPFDLKELEKTDLYINPDFEVSEYRIAHRLKDEETFMDTWFGILYKRIEFLIEELRKINYLNPTTLIMVNGLLITISKKFDVIIELEYGFDMDIVEEEFKEYIREFNNLIFVWQEKELERLEEWEATNG
jgi:hypothetical protein